MGVPDHIVSLIDRCEGMDVAFYEKARHLRNSGYYQKLRIGYLRDHPLCVRCQANGIATFATELDHILPARRKPLQKFFDLDNFQGLCDVCHQEKTIEEREEDSVVRFAPPDGIVVTEDGEVIYGT